MIYLSLLQEETLQKVDKMIQDNWKFVEIQNWLYDNGYIFSQEVKNGYRSKTRFSIEKLTKDENGYTHYVYTFVDLVKRRNGLAYWETYKIS